MAIGMIKLKSRDGRIFDVETKIVQCSKTITDKIASQENAQDSGTMVAIPIPVSGAILEKVLQWADHHKDDVVPEPQVAELLVSADGELSSWDSEYFDNMDNQTLHRLRYAARRLKISELVDQITSILGDGDELEDDQMETLMGYSFTFEDEALLETLDQQKENFVVKMLKDGI